MQFTQHTYMYLYFNVQGLVLSAQTVLGRRWLVARASKSLVAGYTFVGILNAWIHTHV